MEVVTEPTWTDEANSFRHLMLLLTAEMSTRCLQVNRLAKDATVPLDELVNVCHLFSQFCEKNNQVVKAVRHLNKEAGLSAEISESSKNVWLTSYEDMEAGKVMSAPLADAWMAQAKFTNGDHGTCKEEEANETTKLTKTPEQVQEIADCYRRVMRLTGEELGARCALIVSLAKDVDATPDLLGDIGHIFGSLAENAGEFKQFACCFSLVHGCSENVTDEGRTTWRAGFPTLEQGRVMTPELATAMKEMMGHVSRVRASRGGGGGLAALLRALQSQ